MSALHKAFHTVQRTVIWEARHTANYRRMDFDNEVEINARVEQYHRLDRYREISVTAKSDKYLRTLAQRLETHFVTRLKSVRLHLSLQTYPNAVKHRLDISVWPTEPGPARIEVAPGLYPPCPVSTTTSSSPTPT